MTRSKSVVVSLECGIFVIVALTRAAFSIGNKRVSGVLSWHVALIIYLLGPGAPLGYDAQGDHMYEWTPVHLLILRIGLFAGVAIYSTISHFILRAVFKLHADQP